MSELGINFILKNIKISQVDDCSVKRIGSLPVDHRQAACNNFEYNGINLGFICFNWEDYVLGIDSSERYRGCYMLHVTCKSLNNN